MEAIIEIGKIILMVAGGLFFLSALLFIAFVIEEKRLRKESDKEEKERKETRARRIEIAEVAKKAMIPDLNGIRGCFERAGEVLEAHRNDAVTLRWRTDLNSKLISQLERDNEDVQRILFGLESRMQDMEMAHAVENHDDMMDARQEMELGKKGKKNGNR